MLKFSIAQVTPKSMSAYLHCSSNTPLSVHSDIYIYIYVCACVHLKQNMKVHILWAYTTVLKFSIAQVTPESMFAYLHCSSNTLLSVHSGIYIYACVHLKPFVTLRFHWVDGEFSFIFFLVPVLLLIIIILSFFHDEIIQSSNYF